MKLTTSATTKSQPAVTLPKSPASCCHMGPPPGLASSSLQFTTGPSSFVASAVKQNNGYAAILDPGNCYLSTDSAVWTLACHLFLVWGWCTVFPTLSRKPCDAPLLQPVGSASPHSGDRRWQHRLLVACHSGHSEEAPHGPGLKNQKCYSIPTWISLMSYPGPKNFPQFLCKYLELQNYGTEHPIDTVSKKDQKGRLSRIDNTNYGIHQRQNTRTQAVTAVLGTRSPSSIAMPYKGLKKREYFHPSSHIDILFLQHIPGMNKCIACPVNISH